MFVGWDTLIYIYHIYIVLHRIVDSEGNSVEAVFCYQVFFSFFFSFFFLFWFPWRFRTKVSCCGGSFVQPTTMLSHAYCTAWGGGFL
jgi:hypothetical protein